MVKITSSECPISGFPVDDLGLVKKPLDAKEITSLITGTSVATGAQLITNASARQILANTKIAADSGKDIVGIFREKGLGFFCTGLSSRLSYQAIGLLPALLIRNEMRENGFSPLSSSLTANSYETIVGTAMEVRSAKKVFGIDDPLKAASHAVLPFAFRNYLGWLALSIPSQGMTQQIGYGLAAGLISAVPDSIGNKMMMQKENLPIFENFVQAIKGLNKQTFFRAAPIRGLAGAASAAILSDQTQEFICSSFNSLLEKYHKAIDSPDSKIEKSSAKSLEKKSQEQVKI